ncbi:Tm-1-like ATP-binding domain-containing protein [Bradyrhizobium arachidis]|uniref:Tm-1-like ATP-binding domain-containing protein n=1 Tax=Bradyrhizobium arachidis TaxID=858423 RepID=UPI0021628E49|nr:Tm-1-like ATP-binding domain-containing protein [Bradyrhizobium arachidis]UVO35846.1 Tm-1-like ATP-binding domain-containing protein [Bradyrhizobium arachidis]
MAIYRRLRSRPQARLQSWPLWTPSASRLRYVPAKHGRERKIVAITPFRVTARGKLMRGTSGRDRRRRDRFPANGAGGRKMEQLIAAGEFGAVLDPITTELPSSGRLKAASRQSIPQVIAPGAVDMVDFGPPASVPDQFRHFSSHTPYTTLMRTTSTENASIGWLAVERLSRAQGPTTVLWPAKGVSDYDRQGRVFRDADADRAWLQADTDNLRPEITIREQNCHIKDSEFAQAAVTRLLEQLGPGGSPRADV